MTLVVLGGTGFVGSHVVRHARSLGLDPIVASRRTGLNLLDLDASVEVLRSFKPTAIVNCAAHVGSVNFVTERAAEVIDVNMRMQLNVFRAISIVAPGALIVNPIANCAYPGSLEIYSEESLWDGPLHPSVASYGSTRRMMITLSECYARQRLLRVVNYLVPNMYGPFDSTNPDKAHALNALASKVVKAKNEGATRLEVWGTGAAVREWLYAGDFARVALQTLERPELTALGVTNLNIGQRRGLSVKELVQLIVSHGNFSGEVRWDPSKPEGAPRKVMDNGRFLIHFPDFQFTDIVSGLRATLQHYESEYPY